MKFLLLLEREVEVSDLYRPHKHLINRVRNNSIMMKQREEMWNMIYNCLICNNICNLAGLEELS